MRGGLRLMHPATVSLMDSGIVSGMVIMVMDDGR